MVTVFTMGFSTIFPAFLKWCSWKLIEGFKVTMAEKWVKLPETNSKFAPKNGWLEYDPFLLGRPIFKGYVSFREGKALVF